MLVAWVQACDHETERITAETLPEKASELGVTIRHEVALAFFFGRFSQCGDYKSECHETFVDFDAFFGGDVTGLALALAAS